MLIIKYLLSSRPHCYEGGKVLNFRKLQFKHTPVPTELYTHTQLLCLTAASKTHTPKISSSIFPCYSTLRLAALDSQFGYGSSGKDWAFFFFTVGLETLEFHRPDSSMSDLTIETLCYIYPAPELVTVLFYFLTWSGSFYNQFLYLFRDTGQESNKGRDTGDFKLVEGSGSQVIDQLEEIKQEKILGVRHHCFHDLRREVMIYLRDTVC